MYYYSQVNCKIIGETKTDVKAVIDYIQEKHIATFFHLLESNLWTII